MTTDKHTMTTVAADEEEYVHRAVADRAAMMVNWLQNGLHWEARLWDVAKGHPLTPEEAQRLAEWVAYTIDT